MVEEEKPIKEKPTCGELEIVDEDYNCKPCEQYTKPSLDKFRCES